MKSNKLFLFLFILNFVLSYCSRVPFFSGKDTSITNNLIRFFQISSGTKLYLSVKGQLKDGNGKPMAYAVMSQNTTGISTATSIRAGSAVEKIRCADYSLASSSIQCIKIIKPDNFSKKSSDGCYVLYLGTTNNPQARQIAKVRNIQSGQLIRYFYTKKLEAGISRYTAYSCSGEYLAEEAITDTTSGTITDASGNYTIKAEAGKLNIFTVKTPAEDKGDIKIDLTGYSTKETLTELSQNPANLPVTVPTTLQTSPVSAGVIIETIPTASNTPATETTPAVSIDPATLIQIAEAETTTISLPTVTYSGSPFTFTQNLSITTQTPTVTGTVTSCTASPTLPAGLSIAATTCVISGTPTTVQSATSYTITATNSAGNTTATISIKVLGTWVQDAYLKASNAGAGDNFGRSVSTVSGDYLVVGANGESNSSTGIDNTDNASITDTGTAASSGAVYIFKRNSSTGDWSQDAYLKASNTGASDYFGNSVSISGDYIVVGAYGEGNSSTSINNTDNASITDAGTVVNTGAAYIFKRDSSTGNWSQDAYLKTSNAGSGDKFGITASISGDYVVVGANVEGNSSTSINNTDNASITDAGTAASSGAVYIFKRNSSTGDWSQDAYLKASNAEASDQFGISVSISGDYAVVGAYNEGNTSTSINNTDNASITDAGTVTNVGAAYIFKRDSSTGDWIQDAYLKASNAEAADQFGNSVSISGDYAIVGAHQEDNSSTSINNTDNVSITDVGTATQSGAAYIFKRNSSTGDWSQDAYLKASNAAASSYFGISVSINGDFAVVGAYQEGNTSTSINNTDNASITDTGTTSFIGAAYIFKRDSSTGDWILDAYLKASNAGASDAFGLSVSVSGGYVVVGANLEDNGSTSINNTDNASITDAGAASNSGAVYIFKLK
ncbi:MAG: putative Ig domain-containing protein [Leptospiraceae bacterium]|nr:putative Ig domain-containing protein [Leptospiraceae bacterium]